MGIENLKTVLKSSKRTFELKSPFMGASGTYGYINEYEEFLKKEYTGGIVTKGITMEERLGNDGERLFETASGMINRIGLENVGIEKFINEKLPVLEEKKIDYILNIAGSKFEDYETLGFIAQISDIKAIELNVSCPNVESGCIEFGLNPKTLKELVERVRKKYDGFLIVKLSPNVTDIRPLAKAAEQGGADCISAINTLHGLGIEIKYDGEKFIKKSVQGGLSGRCIKPVSLYCIKQIRSVTDLPIIAAGGISKFNDILEFMSVGADAFQIGTENFTHPSIISKLTKELEEYIFLNGFKTFENLKKTIKEQTKGKK